MGKLIMSIRLNEEHILITLCWNKMCLTLPFEFWW